MPLVSEGGGENSAFEPRAVLLRRLDKTELGNTTKLRTGAVAAEGRYNARDATWPHFIYSGGQICTVGHQRWPGRTKHCMLVTKVIS